MLFLSAAIFVDVDNAVNQKANESSILIGRISKQESNQRILHAGYIRVITKYVWTNDT